MRKRTCVIRRRIDGLLTGVLKRKPIGFFKGEEKVIKRIKQLHRKPRDSKRLGAYKVAQNLNKQG